MFSLLFGAMVSVILIASLRIEGFCSDVYQLTINAECRIIVIGFCSDVHQLTINAECRIIVIVFVSHS